MACCHKGLLLYKKKGVQPLALRRRAGRTRCWWYCPRTAGVEGTGGRAAGGAGDRVARSRGSDDAAATAPQQPNQPAEERNLRADLPSSHQPSYMQEFFVVQYRSYCGPTI
eukprot:COSAG01_NODE_8068_length_2934_cov_2.512703_5_plen_111_part_00